MIDNDRKIVLKTGRLGAIEYLELLYEKLGYNQDEIKNLVERDSNNMPEGVYSITDNGLKYQGKYNDYEKNS